jgi:hypothetical protein
MTCYSSDFTHKHHNTPRYMGGSNLKENLVEVTVTQHAKFINLNLTITNPLDKPSSLCYNTFNRVYGVTVAFDPSKVPVPIQIRLDA